MAVTNPPRTRAVIEEEIRVLRRQELDLGPSKLRDQIHRTLDRRLEEWATA